MVVDNQGAFDPAGSGGAGTYKLTDPALHCLDSMRFGSTNHLEKGMKAFFKTHKCNGFCRAMGLKAAAADGCPPAY